MQASFPAPLVRSELIRDHEPSLTGGRLIASAHVVSIRSGGQVWTSPTFCQSKHIRKIRTYSVPFLEHRLGHTGFA